MESVKVHRVNFFEPQPFAIRNIVFDENSSQLAVARTDYSIEIWHMKNKPFLQMVIPPHPLQSVEALAWSSGRLFSATLQGYVIEHDLSLQKHKQALEAPTSCSVWCIGVNKTQTQLAAGTEDGHICLYDIAQGVLELIKFFNKQEGRILCLDWHESGEVIVTGSIDSIHVWNVKSGQAVERIIVGHSEKNIDTIVWCLSVTRDMTIISGDSRGLTCFWDGKKGVLLSSSAAHKADVLTLCLSKDERTVHTAGVDPVIITYRKSQINPEGHEWDKKWMKSGQRAIHTHDVHALELAGDYLISGGVDAKLTLSKFPPKIVIENSPLAQPYVSVATKSNLLLLRYPNSLEVWKLPKSLAFRSIDGTPVKYAVVKSKQKDRINCAAISPDGTWIAYTCAFNKLKLFHLLKDVFQPEIRRVKCLPQEVKFCINMVFLSDNMLALYISSKIIHILACDLSEPKVVACLEMDGLEDIHLMSASPDEKHLAVSSHDGKIHIYNMNTKEVHSQVPFYQCPITAMKFDLESENLVIAYSNRKVVEYNLERCKYSDWSRKQSLGDLQDCSPYAFKGIAHVPQDKHALILYDEETIYVIDKLSARKPEKKRPKVSENEVQHVAEYKVINKYKYLLDLCLINEMEMVAVEVRPEDICVTLPPPLYRKKYGT